MSYLLRFRGLGHLCGLQRFRKAIKSSMASLPAAFQLERYFDKYEFTTRYPLCCSDVEALTMHEVIKMADEDTKAMWENLSLSYTEVRGHPLLRKEIASLHDMNHDDIFVVAPQEGIYIAMNCLINYLKGQNGDSLFHAISTYPAYQSLYEILKTVGCDLSYWNVKESATGWVFDLDELISMIKPETKLLVVNFPHNPTGYIPGKEKWEKLIEICKTRGIFLFSDEMYRLSNNDGTEPLTSASTLYENSIALFGMSKTFAMPGLRIGWLATKNKEVLEMMYNFKDYITICPPGPSEILSIISLRNKNFILQQHTMAIIKHNLDILDKFFANHEDIFTWYRPVAGTTAFVRIKGWLLNIGSGGATGFCDKLVKEKEVLLLPSAMFDHEDCFIRLGFGRRNMEECLNVLKEFIAENRPEI